VELLEDRTLLSVISLWIDGELSIRSDSNDDIVVETNGNLEVVVRVNGLEDTSLPQIPASAVRSIIVEGGDLPNLIDLRSVSFSDFTYFDPITSDRMTIIVEGRDGADTIFASLSFDDVIDGGDGNDSIFGGNGNNLLQGGAGNDFLDGAGGVNSLFGGEGTDTLRLIVDSFDDTVDANVGDGVAADGDGHVTLRAALMESNATGGGYAVELPAGTFTLSRSGSGEDAAVTGDYDITEDFSITGAGIDQTFIDADGLDRLFDIAAGVTAHLTDVTISGGRVTGIDSGGGIRNAGSLVLSDSVVADNSTSLGGGGGLFNTGSLAVERTSVSGNSTYGYGGAIYNAGTLQISRSTLYDNTAYAGGGLFNDSSGDSSLVWSTLSGNSTSGGAGGGISNNDGLLALAHTTIAGNSSVGNGGGVQSSVAATTEVQNTLIATNNATADGEDVHGSFASLGYNLIGNADGSTGFGGAGGGDQLGTGNNPIDAILSPLRDNRGMTLTHALLPGSPAIDAGFLTTGDVATDQCGIPVPLDGDDDNTSTVDIGAFEFILNATPTLDVIDDPPAILPDLDTQTLGLTGISAGSGEAQELMITAVSSNMNLIPHPSVDYTSGDTVGTLSFASVPGTHGSAIITVTIADAGYDETFDTYDDEQLARSFRVTVNTSPSLNGHGAEFTSITEDDVDNLGEPVSNLLNREESEFPVSAIFGGVSEKPSVAALSDGGFIVTWQNQDDSSRNVYGQRYGVGGNTVGSEFRVNTFTEGQQQNSSVAALTDGGFLVTWESKGQDWDSDGQDGSGNGIYGQRYNSGGNATGSEFQINTFTEDNQQKPSVAALTDGSFVVTWQSDGQDGSGNGIYGQRYNSGGNATGSEFQINTFTVNDEQFPSVSALIDGGFIVAWSANGPDRTGGGYGAVYGQRFHAGGIAAGSEFQINTFTDNGQHGPSVIGLAHGGFVVTWMSYTQDGGLHGVYGQRYGSDANATGSEFQINTFTPHDQRFPSVAALSDGGFIVTWESNGQDGSNLGVFGQRYNAEGNPQFHTLNDADSGSAEGIAIISTVETHGTWEFSIDDGVTWSGVGHVSENPALLLREADRLRFIPDEIDGGTSSITYRGWDQSGSTVGQHGTKVDASNNGGATPFSAETDTATINVTPINDAPVIVADQVLMIDENSDSGTIAEWLEKPLDLSGVVSSWGEFLVNTHTEGDQYNPSVAALSDGGFVGTWMLRNQDGSDYGIYGQRYSAAGNPVGDEFLVNTHTEGDQYNPSVAALSDGGFVVVWYGLGDGDDVGIYGRRYDAVGEAIGGDFQINSYADNTQGVPSVATFSNGSFIVTWQSEYQDGEQWGVFGQRYDGVGNAIGDEFSVNTYTRSGQHGSSVASLSDDGFVVTWTSDGQDGSGLGVYGQRYDSEGNESGGEFRVNTYTYDYQAGSSIAALSDGRFVVTWYSRGQDGSSHGIYGQQYDAEGNASGGEFKVNTYTESVQTHPSVTALSGSGFVVTWRSWGQDGSDYGIYGQRYSAAGNPVGDEFQVNTWTAGSQVDPAVTALSDGGFVVMWASEGQNGGIYGKHLDLLAGVLVSDADYSNRGLSFEIAGGNTNTAFVIDDFGRITVNNPSELNFEVKSSFDLLVEVNDNHPTDPRTHIETVTINVVDSVESIEADSSDWADSGLTVSLSNGLLQIQDSTTTESKLPPHALDHVHEVVVSGRENEADVLTVDFTNGIPLPVAGMRFDGGGTESGNDVLVLTGGSVGTIEHTFITPQMGDIRVDGRTISYVHAAVTEQVVAEDRVFNFSIADDVLIVGDDEIPDNGISRITNSTTGRVVDFPNPSGYLRVHSGHGNDTITVTSLDTLFSGQLVLNGGGGNDVLEGGVGDDRMIGGGGHDLLIGGGGDDYQIGNAGSDTLFGGDGHDRLNGAAGNDHIFGGDGNDRMLGGGGRDRMEGQAGDDRLMGHGSSDTLFGGPGDDRLRGGIGSDQLNGEDGDDELRGEDGNDSLHGGPGFDILRGQDGNDRLTGGLDDDRIIGGRGFNMLIEAYDADFWLSETMLTGIGDDQLSRISAVRLTGGDGANRMDASGFAGKVSLYGGAGDDLLMGGNSDDFLDGGAGNDGIVGHNGHDILVGRSGADTLIGGDGDDRLYGGTDSDVVLGGNGNDRIKGQGSTRDTIAGGQGDDVFFDPAYEINENFTYWAEWVDAV
jgi:Ca2+-binding RTX toxin-like protein